LADPRDRAQLLLGRRRAFRDGLERDVGEDDVRRDLRLLGGGGAPGLEAFEQSLVVVGRAGGAAAEFLLGGGGEGLGADAAVDGRGHLAAFAGGGRDARRGGGAPGQAVEEAGRAAALASARGAGQRP